MKKLLLMFALGSFVLVGMAPQQGAAQTPSQEFDQCLIEAVEAAERRAEEGDGNRWTRLLEFGIDVFACTAEFVTPM